MRITLPYPPSVNHYYNNFRGRRIISDRGRSYRQNVIEVFNAKKCLGNLDGDLSMTIRVHPPDRRRRDLDNILKAVLDSLQHAGAYEDDSQIHRLLVIKDEVIKNGKLEIEIKEMRQNGRNKL